MKNFIHNTTKAHFQRLAELWQRIWPWGHGVLYLAFALPFSTYRHVRIHGDEKVYVGQALEMLRAGHFWQQLQFGEINYIKGPLHYLLLILGHTLFGFSMTATVYMNLLLAAFAIVALRAASDTLFPKATTLRALPAWLFASSGAFVMFTYSSQMDSEVTSIYALVLALSVLARQSGKTTFYALLWILTGLAGTLKSPLHSLLLGISVVLYFLFSGALFSQLLGKKSRVACLVLGIAVCTSGYALPFLLDSTNWLDTYIYREQINRPRFSDSGFMFLLNNFVLNLFPWSFLALFSIFFFIKTALKKNIQMDESIRAGLAFFVPTFLFFYGLGYRAAWYGLPLLSSVWILLLAPLLNRYQELGFIQVVARSMIPCVVLFGVLGLVCHFMFFDGTSWWNLSNTLWVVGVCIASIVFLELAGAHKEQVNRTMALALGVATFWMGALGLTATLGEAETADLRSIIKDTSTPIRYSNVNKENYNEWGYMAYMLGRPTHFANSFEDLFEAAARGEALVFMTKDELDGFWAWTHSQVSGNVQPHVALDVWRRWPRNARQLKEIWSARETTENIWDRVTRHYYVVRFADAMDHPPGARTAEAQPTHAIDTDLPNN